MEETPALVFKYKCRRNMFVARPAICRPVVQSPTPIVSFHHRPTRKRTDGKESHVPIVAALNPLRKVLRSKGVAKTKTEPKLKETGREKAASATNKEVTLEFQKSYNSSLHLNVSPSSSIKFDRRDASSRLKLLAVVQSGESEEHTVESASTAFPPGYIEQLPNFPKEEEEKSTSLKSPGKLDDTAMELPLWTKISHFQGDLLGNGRPGSVGDIETVTPRKLASSCSLPTPVQQKRGSDRTDFKWGVGRPSVTRSATKSPHNCHRTIVSPQAKRRSPMKQLPDAHILLHPETSKSSMALFTIEKQHLEMKCVRSCMTGTWKEPCIHKPDDVLHDYSGIVFGGLHCHTERHVATLQECELKGALANVAEVSRWQLSGVGAAPSRG
ncbi:unnamed protein product [Taenia asiatica]|uniref:TPX2_importin domain-containing protein n=1 Tax=Taenia asiatica TaxID=60517 RepID=A0A0R3W6Q0_TAEAS|nr:unnamed protein product [Taenia asiatica]